MDLGVIINEDLKCNEHMASIFGKANGIQDMLKRMFEIID